MTPAEDFVVRAIDLAEWQSLECDPLTLTVHRYPDCWWVLWHSPRARADLGREVETPEALRGLLMGNLGAGKVLTIANCGLTLP